MLQSGDGRPALDGWPTDRRFGTRQELCRRRMLGGNHDHECCHIGARLASGCSVSCSLEVHATVDGACRSRPSRCCGRHPYLLSRSRVCNGTPPVEGADGTTRWPGDPRAIPGIPGPRARESPPKPRLGRPGEVKVQGESHHWMTCGVDNLANARLQSRHQMVNTRHQVVRRLIWR